MSWPGRLEAAAEVDIETQRAEDGPVHRTTIWAVVTDGVVYVRSLRGGAGRWYQELRANPRAVVHVEGESIPVTAVPAVDPESVERASDGFRRKYKDSPHMPPMIADEILDTTLRLEPR
jgi:hypothetical protein